jgi:hypothetical protein
VTNAASQRYTEISEKKSGRTSGKSDVASMTDEKGSIWLETEYELSLSVTRRKACQAKRPSACAESATIGAGQIRNSEDKLLGERSPHQCSYGKLARNSQPEYESAQQKDSTTKSPLAARDHQPQDILTRLKICASPDRGRGVYGEPVISRSDANLGVSGI